MTDLSMRSAPGEARTRTRLRFVTAASLFDGHDASINIVRRLLQAAGAEVIHLGHNRSVEEIVTAAIEEDVHGIAVSSYQGGHIEFFRYMLDMLRERGAGHIKVFAGGGGVIVPAEIEDLHAYGVARIYSPEDGARMGLVGMIGDMARLADADLTHDVTPDFATLVSGDRNALARVITLLEAGTLPEPFRAELRDRAQKAAHTPVLGITGTGGSGKSSLTDELTLRFRLDQGDRLNIAILAIDPSRRRTGGALLGDRIRMNAIGGARTYMRSLATREGGTELTASMPDVVAACKAGGFDLIIVETPGIGQGDTAITALSDVSLYVMTPEYGAASQLEKIDMLDFADFIAINKFDRRGAEDALRDVRKQVLRNRETFGQRPEDLPVFGTIAARFNDDGTTALYHALKSELGKRGLDLQDSLLPVPRVKSSSRIHSIIPPSRVRYLAEVAQTVRAYHSDTKVQARLARERQQLRETKRMLLDSRPPDDTLARVDALIAEREAQLDEKARCQLEEWPSLRERYAADEYVVTVRDQKIPTSLFRESLSGTRIPKVALPRFEGHGEMLDWLRRENLPGHFPYTAGVFEFKREDEDPTRMFAGEGDPASTNRRFKYLSRDARAKRLSTAFDSVTLYGFDPDERPDIYGKVGNSGVSIATLDDMKALYDGFDLTAPDTSVSMTINGPAPAILAMFLNTAIDQKVDAYEREHGQAPAADEAARIRDSVLQTVRGTVQADILKEDQGQNTCIFSTEFALRMMGDIAEYFAAKKVRNFYSVSISGYHIAEAGANPISQLAFTLANGFTYVEAYLARGMAIDDFAPNLSFFFSNGMEPEYSVIGRVARRIWAIAMRDRYGASSRSQKLKYHCQTSGRSLHAQEIDFNDIRSTLQALIAAYDNANSLHTNAFDEAITTPTEASVRRALAIQLIINREWGLAKNENPNQGSFVIEELTDLVEAAVLEEFDRIAERGGVLGAMELGYQRAKIQEESLYYETRKHDGSLPIVGVNTFRNPAPTEAATHIDLARSTAEQKASQIRRLRAFQTRNESAAGTALERLKQVAIAGGNIFEELMETVRVASLGEITHAFFEVGGRYRRNM